MRVVCWFVLLVAWQRLVVSNGFVLPPRSHNNGGGYNNGNFPRSARAGEGDDANLPSASLSWMSHEEVPDEQIVLSVENGAGRTSLHPSSPSSERLIASTSRPEKARATNKTYSLASAAQYWNNFFASTKSTIAKPFQKVNQAIRRKFRSPQQKAQDEMMQTILTTPVKQVVITPDTTVLPSTVVHIAARRSGLLGQPLGIDRVQEFARSIQRWYARQGYVLHSVTGATLVPETGTAEIRVQEPTTADEPVRIVFCKEMVIDPETGDLVTFRQYADKHTQRRTFGFNAEVARKDLNWTYVPTPVGRTRPRRIAAALGLAPGEHFRWNESRWKKIVGSGIFKRVLQAAPKTVDNGTVQLQMLVHEAPPRHLEYGLSKSLYTGDWEGELDFEHANLLGGGESLGFTLRRGTKGPSGRLRFSDDRFGLEGGYDVELFSDYIGEKEVNVDKTSSKPPDAQETLLNEESAPFVEAKKNTRGPLLDHRSGATFRLRNPIDRKLMLNSVATASVEHVTTAEGSEESIASTSLGVGPFVRSLPRGARSNFDASIMLGSRFPGKLQLPTRENISERDPLTHFAVPYSSITATTRQTFPVVSASKRSTRPIVLALRHSVVTSTKSLPKHEGRAQGLACNIRGAGDIGSISSAITGTTEIRVPVSLPIDNMEQDASIVLFGDWLFAKESTTPSYIRKSCIGLGLRKTLQGIPLKINISYLRGEGKIKSTFGLGRDFEI
ncbi:hypothetical protein FisN_10Hh317 [Fistulifera solaris]|jgi:hypothetical protein|uniref:Bacterial surface antigen (D15) domain-containing protein n=1 Tax=Fistulifera solaris TaxID=1519565 RepID=A0A1Z5K4P7_FISSO|nr:hypothetical protein FisN_10Hh317 [Fistulifera solaris]|eukprot:GAX21195.1 hypothetical protein FisN_10Hh317 [Fistulifera solaris]